MSDPSRIRADSDKEYDHFHRTLEVQVFPQSLRATWDDTGCCVCMAVILLIAVSGMITSALFYHWTRLTEAVVSLSDTWALFAETGLLICVIFCAGIILGFIVMCLCGLNTQMMAAQKRCFGSLRKNRILLSLIRGESAWDEPDFQRRLRQRDRRLERVQDTVEARMESWLAQRSARVRYMQALRYQLAKQRTRMELESKSSAIKCAIL